MGALLFVLGLALGASCGYALAARALVALRRERAQRNAELRNHVLPLLEHRASASGVRPEDRALDEPDALRATIALGRAIQINDARRDLPFTDTLEVDGAHVANSGSRRRSSEPRSF